MRVARLARPGEQPLRLAVRRAGLSCLIAVLGVGVGAGTAWAEASVQVRNLCSEAAVPCSIQVNPQQREGAASDVMITGRARSVVTVQAFRLAVTDGQATSISPLGDPVEVRTNDTGFGWAGLTFEPLEADQDGGWILVAPSDVTWDDPSALIGVVASFAARRPTILGDGYGTEKPVGQPLDLQLTNAIENTRFTVEYLADDGSWQDASTTGGSTRVAEPDGITTVSYTVPQGLEARPYLFRLNNLTDPSAEAQQWEVTPAVDPPAQDRTAMLEPPELGSDVAGAALAGDHPEAEFRVSLIALTVVALGWLLGWVGLAARRRSHLVKVLGS